MWIIRLALRRPYTFVVAAILLVLITPFVLSRTPTDIFPSINIPVVSVIWGYTGLPADQIAGIRKTQPVTYGLRLVLRGQCALVHHGSRPAPAASAVDAG